MGVLVGYVYTAKSDVTDGVYIDAVKEHGYMTKFPDVTVSLRSIIILQNHIGVIMRQKRGNMR